MCIKDDNQTTVFVFWLVDLEVSCFKIKQIAYTSADSCMNAKGFAMSSSQSLILQGSYFILSRMGNNKQLLDEVEHDIMNYQNRGLYMCYLPKPKAEHIIQTRGFDNS